MDPSSVLTGASGILSGMKALASSAGPSSAMGSSPFDSSGWNVNFGSGSIDSARSQSAGGAGLDPYLPYILVAAGVLIAWRMTK